MATISLIAAMAHDRVIGKDGQLPWYVPADLKHFKKTTLGKPVVMGRITFDSIKKPLPGRQNIIISRQESLEIPGAKVVRSLEEALSLAADADEIMICGGGMIYEMAMPLARRMYLTFIDLAVDGGNAFFPEWASDEWAEVASESHEQDEKNKIAYRFVTYERR